METIKKVWEDFVEEFSVAQIVGICMLIGAIGTFILTLFFLFFKTMSIIVLYFAVITIMGFGIVCLFYKFANYIDKVRDKLKIK